MFCPFLTSNDSFSRVADLDPALYKCLVGIITVFCGSDNCNISRVGSRYGQSKPGAETLIYMLDLKMYINISELIWDKFSIFHIRFQFWVISLGCLLVFNLGQNDIIRLMSMLVLFGENKNILG